MIVLQSWLGATSAGMCNPGGVTCLVPPEILVRMINRLLYSRNTLVHENLLVRYSEREGLSPAADGTVPMPDLPRVNRTGRHSPCLPNSANGLFIS